MVRHMQSWQEERHQELFAELLLTSLVAPTDSQSQCDGMKRNVQSSFSIKWDLNSSF